LLGSGKSDILFVLTSPLPPQPQKTSAIANTVAEIIAILFDLNKNLEDTILNYP
jgi:hypothetical protein